MYPVRDGLPPIPPLIPSPTSPGAPVKFVHYKQTISPTKTFSHSDTDMPLKSERDDEVGFRKRAHSPDKNHFNFETSETVSKKRAFAHDTSAYNRSDSTASQGNSVLNYAGTPRTVVHNGTHSSKEAVRLSRRDPGIPSRLSDYEMPHIKTAHQKVTRVMKNQDTSTPVIKYSKTNKNGHLNTNNGFLEVKKEPFKPAVNRTVPANNLTPTLSPKSSDEDSALSPLSPTSPYQQGYSSPAGTERTRRTSSSSTDSGTEEPGEGE